MLTRETLQQLPKLELHLHLDCSLGFDVVNKIDPTINLSEYHEKFIAPQKCLDLADYLKCTLPGIQLMQTEEHLRWVVRDLFEQLAAENVIYAEIRYAPLQHLDAGLKAEQVVEIIADETQNCIEKTGIHGGLFLCTLRHFSEAESLQTVKLVHQYWQNTPVVGFDIAADEAGFPIDAHVPAFEYAIKHDIPRIAHAGEARGPESVWETLKYFQPSRLGHGVRSIEDKKLMDHLIKTDVHLEVCPSCNIQIDIYDEYQNHPVDQLFQAGVSLGINTDTRTLTDVTLTDEYERLAAHFGWTAKHFKQVNLNAISQAFISETEKSSLKAKLLDGYSGK